MICGSGGSKSRLAKAAGAEPAGQMRDEKLHAVVARSTFASENAKSTSCSEHFWKLRCRKSACSWGAKHMSKSKCTKHTRVGVLLEVDTSKKCTPLWREAHFEVNSVKDWWVWSTFGRSDVVSRGRRKRLCTASKVSKTRHCCRRYSYNHHYATLHSTTTTTTTATTLRYTKYIPLHYTPLHYTALTTLQQQLQLQLQLQLPLHYTTLH